MQRFVEWGEGGLPGVHPKTFLTPWGSGQPWSLSSLLNSPSPQYISLSMVSGHSPGRTSVHLYNSTGCEQHWGVDRAGIFIPILQMRKLIASE